jgi:hypothetical protein
VNVEALSLGAPNQSRRKLLHSLDPEGASQPRPHAWVKPPNVLVGGQQQQCPSIVRLKRTPSMPALSPTCLHRRSIQSPAITEFRRA